MKKAVFRSSMLLVASLCFVIIGCSKHNPVSVPSGTVPADYTERPDFATLDNRPPEVIALYQVTEKDAGLVQLDESTPKGAKYALVIGISDYYGTANDLQFCDDDARDWKDRLVLEGYNVTIILDGSATKSAIESAINTLVSRSIAGNEIAFCYSGHGSFGNIITTDMYYMRASWFKTKFSTAKSTKMMFCFDACQIGAMASELKATGRVIAVASNATLSAYDGDAYMKNGVFTYYQMRAFDAYSYEYLEPDCDYACRQMKNWAISRGLSVAPSYVDSYPGYFDL